MARFRVTKTSLQRDFKFNVNINVTGKIQFNLRNESSAFKFREWPLIKYWLMIQHWNYLSSTKKTLFNFTHIILGVPLNTLRGKNLWHKQTTNFCSDPRVLQLPVMDTRKTSRFTLHSCNELSRTASFIRTAKRREQKTNVKFWWWLVEQRLHQVPLNFK